MGTFHACVLKIHRVKLGYVTSNQHKDVSEARQIRDGKYITSLHQYLLNNPFVADQSLRNISSGVTCDGTVNSGKAEEVGI